MAFSLFPLSQYESGQTSMKRPREFTYFSYDDKKQLYTRSLTSLRYYYPPLIQAPGTSTPGICLSNGFQDWIKADDTIDGHLDALLETIQKHEEQLMADDTTALEEVKTKADIITWRGMMTKIMTAAFDIFSDFEMNATCFQERAPCKLYSCYCPEVQLTSVRYLEENHDYKMAEEQDSKQRQPPRRGQPPQEMMQYWGYKFESLSVLPKPWSECTRDEIESRDSDVVNNNEQYCSVVRTGIGKSTLVIGGEVDCILGEKPSNSDDPVPWVELKTTAEPPNDHPREIQKFERKLLKFWAQSFLLGVPKVMVGYRTVDGFLTRIQEFETQRIPGLVSRGQGSWNGNVCINMTAAFLEALKSTIMGMEGVWRIKRAKNSKHIELFQIEQTGTGRIVSKSFKAHREKMLANEVVQKLGGRAMESDGSR